MPTYWNIYAYNVPHSLSLCPVCTRNINRLTQSEPRFPSYPLQFSTHLHRWAHPLHPCFSCSPWSRLHWPSFAPHHSPPPMSIEPNTHNKTFGTTQKVYIIWQAFKYLRRLLWSPMQRCRLNLSPFYHWLVRLFKLTSTWIYRIEIKTVHISAYTRTHRQLYERSRTRYM